MSSRVLKIVEVRLFPKEDGVEHHTDRYDTSTGAVHLRRGQEFHLAITFSGVYEPRAHLVLLQFRTGGGAGARLHTGSDLMRVREPSSPAAGGGRGPDAGRPARGEWNAVRAGSLRGNVIAVTVMSPSWLAVGIWQLEVRTESVDYSGAHPSTYTYPGHIYFLFNPWNKDDDTYFEESGLLEEYVMNDIGHVWETGRDTPKFTWDYGQFHSSVLPAFELALQRDGLLPHHRRGNPVDVVRAISRAVNNFRKGIVAGNWETDRAAYADGKEPWFWSGSAEILQLYLDLGEPVRYGQCWVFAAVAVTFCRALGIPARLVTNWVSGHDNDMSLTLDTMYDSDLELTMEERIWDFHCWFDAWMQRSDLLLSEYDGWQAVDGTPQERSGGEAQCGPAPLKAICNGDTQVLYDVPFIFTEVNGDQVRWWIKPDGRLGLIDVKENALGQAVLTDEPLSAKPRVSNITSQYKPPEGSARERAVVKHAANSGPQLAHAARLRRALEASRFNYDVEFTAFNSNIVDLSEDVYIQLEMENKSKQRRFITFELIFDVVNQHYQQTSFINTSTKMHLVLGAKDTQARRMRLPAREYVGRVRDAESLRCRAKCWVRATEQAWEYSAMIGLAVPALAMQIDEDWVRLGRPFHLFLSFDRAFKIPLTNCRVTIYGSALETEVYRLDDLSAGERFSKIIKIEAARPGPQKVIARFTSSELPKSEAWMRVDVRGSDGAPPAATHRNFRDHMDEIMSDAFGDNFIRY